MEFGCTCSDSVRKCDTGRFRRGARRPLEETATVPHLLSNRAEQSENPDEHAEQYRVVITDSEGLRQL
jgi:hypothetical protein